MISFGEGNTRLVPSARIDQTPSCKLAFTNPTGSYKDRFIKRELLSKSSGKTVTSQIRTPGGVEAIPDAFVAITHRFAPFGPPGIDSSWMSLRSKSS